MLFNSTTGLWQFLIHVYIHVLQSVKSRIQCVNSRLAFHLQLYSMRLKSPDVLPLVINKSLHVNLLVQIALKKIETCIYYSRCRRNIYRKHRFFLYALCICITKQHSLLLSAKFHETSLHFFFWLKEKMRSSMQASVSMPS